MLEVEASAMRAELQRQIGQSSTASINSLRDKLRDVHDLESLKQFCLGSQVSESMAPELLTFLQKMFLCEQLRRQTLDEFSWPRWPVPQWTTEAHSHATVYAILLAETSFTLTGSAEAFLFDLAKQLAAWSFFRISILEREENDN